MLLVLARHEPWALSAQRWLAASGALAFLLSTLRAQCAAESAVCPAPSAPNGAWLDYLVQFFPASQRACCSVPALGAQSAGARVLCTLRAELTRFIS